MSASLIARIGERAAELPGSRVLARFGPVRFMQLFAVAYVALSILSTPLSAPDLVDPTAIGTDTSNYYAAGLRLNAGHPLYAQSAGDRPVPVNPPYFLVPLLSPPPVAVLWRPLALLPAEVAMVAWWAGGLLLCSVAALWMTWRGSIRRSLAMLVLGPIIGLAAWSGNLNAYLAPMMVATWWTWRSGRSATAGALAGIAAAFKLSPALLLVWFAVQRDRRAVLGFLGASAVVGLVSLAGAGLADHLAYLDVVRDASLAGPTPISAPTILAGMGAPREIATLGPLVVVILGVALVVALKRHPGASFGIALLAGIYGTPVVLMVTLALLLGGVAPYPAGRHASKGADS